MKKFTVFSVFVLAFMLAACSSAPKKNPHLDGYWQSKGKKIAYKRFSAPKRWAPGQYIVMGTLDDGDRISVTKTTIVRREAGGWVFESVSTDEDGKVSGTQMLIRGYEQAVKKKDTSKIKVIWMKTLRPDGTVQKIEGDALTIYNMMLKSTWDKVIISGNSYTKAGAVTVPAGTFAGTTMLKASVKLIFTFTQISYLHPGVPVNGLVKATDEDGKVLQVLLDYGFNGKAAIK
ncbi:MAG TPA: hypothetical protein PK906_16045 [Spirochaetota bacterium]|nr:hypothetical protein [Spirochaetota bacterium]